MLLNISVKVVKYFYLRFEIFLIKIVNYFYNLLIENFENQVRLDPRWKE